MNSDIELSNGLSEAEAQARLVEEGYNELATSKPKSAFGIALDVIREPMFLLLVACGGIYVLLGDAQEAIMLLGFVFVIIGITFVQERKTERALEALRDLSSPRALVVRGGIERRISGREVVRDDVIVVAEGDRIPADARLVMSSYLAIDESLLTGESVPVAKSPLAEGTEPMPGDGSPSALYSGTLVVQGKGLARVTAIGMGTVLGKIGKALQSVRQDETRLHRETRRLVKSVALVGVILFGVVVVTYGVTRHDWVQGLLAGITMAMAILPEEFPVILTIFLALGAWRIARQRVLTRRVPALEMLGSATVLCVDKTGTLTQNRMTVKRLYAQGEYCEIDPDSRVSFAEAFHETVEFSILASRVDPFDPMEKAFGSLGERFLANTEHIHHDWSLVREYPLSRDLLAMSHVWQSPDVTGYTIAAKGAPEAILDLCHLDETKRRSLMIRVAAMAKDGLRVLAVAKANLPTRELGLEASEPVLMPQRQHDFPFEFLGLMALSDPVRPAVPLAIRECYGAGVRIVMITGDYAETARNIAHQIGLRDFQDVVTGPELDVMDDETLRERIRTVNIFARVVPEQKLRLVEALKANGEITVMTGDGVNDAPALRAAHIGIAMGERGTDVAREAADLVLLDDDFSSIVRAIRSGRRIFDNLKKAMAYVFAVHVPIAGMSLLPVLFKWPLVLLPLHVVFLELIIDPACSVVFEGEEEENDIMRRSPRRPDDPLFGFRMIALSLLQGVSVLVLVAGVYLWARHEEHGDDGARTMAFITLIVGNLALILANRSWTESIWTTLRRPNRALVWVLAGAATFLMLSLYVPMLRELFSFAPLHVIDIAVSVILGCVGIVWFEGLKAFHRACG